MSDIAAMLAWLREQIESDKAAAEAASGPRGRYTRWDLSEWCGREEPHALIGQGTPDHPCALGHFTPAPVPTVQAEHIVRHDPRDVIARCGAELAILDAYAVTVRLRDEAAERIRAAQGRRPDADDLATWNRAQSEAAVIEDLVRRLAQGYQHRPGWKEDWAA